ncbi:MAG: type II secretion system protein GspE [Candidatus Aquicultor primus]|uniref:Type II secretion system protein GspE n=1 Tax=Candidatus Aquicultor primus TaxID=1797195 RepID=A0A1F2UN06_9ACTN|nr:MAG: type II secretion system protein GspE [Candidatus Aquicultor primus]HCG99729.1 type II secretion system protein GspE [Actinomycetota bacterium]
MLKRKISDFLVDTGIITKDQLSEAIERSSGDDVERQLVDLGYISEAEIAKNFAKQLNLGYVDLAGYDINPQAAALISNEHIRRYNVIPINLKDDYLVVAMADPTNIFAIDDLHVMTGFDITPVVTGETDLINAINKFCTNDDVVEEAIESISEDFADIAARSGEERDAEEAPVVKLVKLIVTEAVRERASDIFIEPQEYDLRVRYRIDGVLHEIMRSPKQIQAGIISRIKIMSGMDIAERRLPQDGRFGLVIDKRPIDFRVASLPTIYGEQLILRVLEKESISMNLDDLGFLSEDLKRFKESFTKPYGAILITGPTGSGKTTTLYGVLNLINSDASNLITVEDPVEYRLHGINQVQVNAKTGLTFASALRSILRQDPDIVMIGEIRDEETATIAVESALTGHLVLSTLHTNGAPAALTRLVEMGIEPFLVSTAVDCIVAQRLARKLCTKCREQFVPTEPELKGAGFVIDGNEPKVLYRARGCKSCGETGYHGRIGLYEVMRMSETIERLLVGDVTAEQIAKVAATEGMSTLHQDGLAKVKLGWTSIEEVERVTMK